MLSPNEPPIFIPNKLKPEGPVGSGLFSTAPIPTPVLLCNVKSLLPPSTPLLLDKLPTVSGFREDNTDFSYF